MPRLAVRCRDPLEDLQGQLGLVPEIQDRAPSTWSWLDVEVEVPADYDGTPRFIHHDFSPDHLIVSRTTGRLSGIIDWSGAALGDPAQDFAYLLLCRGLPFLRRAVEAYRLHADAELTKRAVFPGPRSRRGVPGRRDQAAWEQVTSAGGRAARLRVRVGAS